MYNTVINASNTYFKIDFEKERAKIIPHHLNEGPCKECIVRAICDEFCPFLEDYYFSKSPILRAQMSNYFEKHKGFRIKIGWSK